MKKIVILNAKGGVGKTNITRHLAIAAEIEKPGKVCLYDTDPQASLADWWNARLPSKKPPLAVFKMEDYEDGVSQISSRFDYMFIDTAAANAQPYEEILESADLILIPISPSADDLRAVVRTTLPIVKKSGCAYAFVISRARAGTHLLAAMIEMLSEHGEVCPVVILQREGYTQSATTGSTILEQESKGKGAEEIRQLWDYVKGKTNGKS